MQISLIGLQTRIALMSIICGFVLLSFLYTSVDAKNQPAVQKGTDSKDDIYSGEVKRGHEFKLDIGRGLFFYLRPSHDPAIEGWYIEIQPKDGSNLNEWILNPPYHGYNAKDVNASYDFTAQDAVSYGPREIKFSLNKEDAKKAYGLYELYTSGLNPTEFLKKLTDFPSGKALFTIDEFRLGKSGPENQERGRIEWLKFKIRITFPSERTGENIKR